jgi:gliding-associated putative ABC transporter substrate-binding component GldG
MKRDWASRSTLIVLGLILVLINLIGITVFSRADLTDDGVYSLSSASIDLVEGLDDPVTIKAFFTKDLPAPYSANRRFLKDKLDDYRAYGGRNVQYEFIDPADGDGVREEVTRYRIPPVQIQVIESDNVQLKNAYMGVAIQYGDQRETIPVIENLSTLEYDITSAMRRMTLDELPTIGFLSGHGEPDPAQNMQTLRQGLSRNYQVQTVTVADSALSTTPDVLFVVAPSDTIPDAHLRAIDEFVMNGGRLALLVNQVSANLQTSQATALGVGLESLYRSYGISVRSDLVMDEQSSVVTVQQQAGFFNIARQIEYPFLPVATSFSSNNMMVNRLRDVVFYFASSVDTTSFAPEGVSVEPLVFSSSRSATQEGFFMIQPMMEQAGFSDGPFVLAASYTGEFSSAFDPGRTSLETRIVVVGDGDFINESIVGRIPGNIEFGLNMADWLAQDDDLLQIRSKKIEPRALSEVSEKLRPVVKYSNMFGPALIVIVFGVMRWRRRKGRRFVVLGSGAPR